MKWQPNQKITIEQRDELIELWRQGQFQKVLKLQKQYGVERKYAQKRAYDLGLTKYPDRTKRPADWFDPRWQWAIERGPVVA